MIIQPGTDIGRYHILEQVGEGGMARVYKALDTNLNVKVAVKFIRVDDLPAGQIERTIARFRVEAKKMAQLSHTNIVPVTDYGEYERTPYLVMPLLSGGSLKKYIGAQMEWRTAAKLIAPVAEALAYTHKKGIIHRDVKPANILLTESDDPMLTDFGIAKIIDVAEARQMTLTGSLIGTPEYMAPEQCTSTKFDKRVDIYSLGIVIYELITGRKPFIADTPSAVMIKQSRDPLPRPKNFVPDLPDEVERLLIKALAKDPKDRYKDMYTMAIELRRLASMRTEEEQQMAEKERIRQEQSIRKRTEEEKRRKEQEAKLAAKQAAREREKKEKARHKEQDRARTEKSAAEGKEKKPKLRIDKKHVIMTGGLVLMVLIALLGVQIQDMQRVKRPVEEELKTVTTTETETAVKAITNDGLTAVLIVGGQLGDMSFDDSAYNGMQQASNEFGFTLITKEAHYDKAVGEEILINTIQDPKTDFVVIVNPYELMDLVAQQALSYPEINFIIIDNFFDFNACPNCDNVYAMQYKPNEGSYLAGLYAGLMSETGFIGAVGGMDIPIINEFFIGYMQGAMDAGIVADNILIKYADSWADPAKGKELALSMYQQGVDIIFQVAGGTGEGVFYAAQETGFWAIGVDTDQATIMKSSNNPLLASVILTSMIKRVDKSLYRAFELFYDGSLPLGTNESLGIPDGVSLADNKYFRENTPQLIIDQITAAEQAIINGEIVVDTVF